MWIHSYSLYRDVVVQVQEVKKGPRGFPKKLLGWKAKIELPGLEIISTDFHETDRAAVVHLIQTLNEWTLPKE